MDIEFCTVALHWFIKSFLMDIEFCTVALHWFIKSSLMDIKFCTVAIHWFIIQESCRSGLNEIMGFYEKKKKKEKENMFIQIKNI